MCEPLKSSATERRIAMNGLSVSAQSPIQASSMTSASGPAEKLQSVTASTGHVESATEDCQTHASTSGQSSNGSKTQTYWLEEKRVQDWLETTVYKQDLRRAHYWAGRDTAFSDWTPRHKPTLDGLFCAELEQGLTIADAARLLRQAREAER